MSLIALSESAYRWRSPASKFCVQADSVMQMTSRRRILAPLAIAEDRHMNQHITPSILQRVPVILAVTAASYGLPPQTREQRSNGGTGHALSSTASPSPLERSARDTVSTHH